MAIVEISLNSHGQIKNKRILLLYHYHRRRKKRRRWFLRAFLFHKGGVKEKFRAVWRLR
jgi:hypothetical protein